MYWTNFLHIYQPPTQNFSILKRVVAESYDRLIAGFKDNSSAKVTINVNGCLLDLLSQNGFQKTIDGLRELMARGQLEMTLSAKYHPLLPKLSDSEVIRQIELDWESHKEHFGKDFKISGFFSPEAAYTPYLAKLVSNLGFKWILADELSYNGRLGMLKGDRVYEVEFGEQRTDKRINSRGKDDGCRIEPPFIRSSGLRTPLYVFFREREASFKILSGQLGTCKLFEDYLGERLDREEYLLTAMDGETFGHHRPGMEHALFEIYRSPRVKTATVTELLTRFPRKEEVKTLPSTWALMEKDLEKNAPFSRWDDPDNIIHRKQWQLTELAIKSVNESRYKAGSSVILSEGKSYFPKSKDLDGDAVVIDAAAQSDLDSSSANERIQNDMNHKNKWLEARSLLDKALHSDQYWWASARPWWSLEMIEAGAKELKEAVLAVPDISKHAALIADRLYSEIVTTGFDWQRSGEVAIRARREDEEIRERTDRHLPKLPPEEVKKMIAHIEQEMLTVAERREYERAAQLRDRIRELEEYL